MNCIITKIAEAEYNGYLFELKEYKETNKLLEILVYDSAENCVGRIGYNKYGEPEHFSGVCWDCEDAKLEKFINEVFDAEIENWKKENGL